MVAARVVVDARRAAEFAPGDDGHVVLQAAIVQIFDEGAQRLIELAAVIAHKLEVVRVAVPSAEGEADDACAGLDQAARHQQMLVDGRSAVGLIVERLAVAVAIAHAGPIPGSRSRASRSRLEVRTSKARCVNASSPCIWPVASTSRRRLSKLAEHAAAVGEIVEGRAVEPHVGEGGAVRLEGAIGRAEEAGFARIGPADFAGRPRQADEGRHARIDGALNLGDGGAEARPAADGCADRRGPAGHALEAVMSRRSAPTTERMTAILSMMGRDAREDFADLNAVDARGDRAEIRRGFRWGLRS